MPVGHLTLVYSTVSRLHIMKANGIVGNLSFWYWHIWNRKTRQHVVTGNVSMRCRFGGQGVHFSYVPLGGSPLTFHVIVGWGIPAAAHLMKTSAPIMLIRLSGFSVHLGGSEKEIWMGHSLRPSCAGLYFAKSLSTDRSCPDNIGCNLKNEH